MPNTNPAMKRRRVRKQRIREIACERLGDVPPDADGVRADRIRDLCPCEFAWKEVPLWSIIFAACEDPSPIVRKEALHVIEDSWEHGIPLGRAMRYLYRAQNDPSPEVAKYARDLLQNSIPDRQKKNRERRISDRNRYDKE